MKRLRRILFNALTAISLLLAIFLLCRSLYFQERVAYTTTHRYFAIRTNPGTLTFETIHYPISPFESGWHGWSTEWDSRWPWRRWAGRLRLERESFIIGLNEPPDYSIQDKSPWLNTEWTLDVPIWMIAAIALIACTWQILVCLPKSRRHHPGLCPACGYDMRASPAKCSECGQESAAHAMAGAGGDQQR